MVSINSVAVRLMILLATANGDGARWRPPSREVEWGKAMEGYKLSAAVAKDRYSAAEQVHLSLTLRNEGKAAMVEIAANPLEFYEISATLADGSRVPLTAYGHHRSKPVTVGTFKQRLLEPGEERRNVVHLNRILDMTMPGEYRVTAKTTVRRRDDSSKGAEVVSNVVTITVMEPTEAEAKERRDRDEGNRDGDTSQ